MNFVSVTFLIFLAATFLLYFIFPLKLRWIILLISSSIFYLYAGWQKFIFVIVTATIAYLITGKIEKIYTKDKTNKKEAKKYLVLGVIFILLLLIYVKVGQSLVDAFINVGKDSTSIIKIIIPLGISYYTFAIVGYMLDVYWKKEQAEHNYFKLLLYMIYFPQILQGPIPRHKKLAPQLIEGHPFNYESFCFGLQRMIWGYFKKMVIADRFAIIVTAIFTNYTKYDGLYFVIAVLASVIQLYCDFSGCMDIVIGISECMGIKLDENFTCPFSARTAAEFWRKWHITLGTWFKDYVYMPLVINPRLIKLSQKAKNKLGNRFAKSIMSVIPLAVVWFLTGLWHGTGIDYILWGCYWGMIIIISTVFAPEISKLNSFLHINTESKWWHSFQRFRTFLIFCGGRLLTAPGDIKISWYAIKSILSTWNPWILFDQSIYSLGLDRKDFWVGIIALLLLYFLSNKQEQGMKIRETIASYPLVIRWAVYYSVIIAVLVLGMYGSGHSGGTFVYMNY